MSLLCQNSSFKATTLRKATGGKLSKRKEVLLLNECITAHQRVLLQILCELDRICRKHGIPYVLFAGSAIGAARHQGFIPWDDDIDVAMLREDYERFLRLAQKDMGEDFFLQKEFSEHWPMFFSKLRRNGTTCIERFIPKDTKMHQGIYIDIFPIDNLSDNRLVQRLQFAASKVVIAKSLDRRGYLTDSGKKKFFIWLCRLLPLRPMLRFAKKAKKKNSAKVHSFFAAASAFEKNIYRRDCFTETTQCSFEGESFPISQKCHEILTQIYGDYMTFPSEEEKESKIHGVIVDTEHSYERYLEEQRKMKVTKFAKSIR